MPSCPLWFKEGSLSTFAAHFNVPVLLNTTLLPQIMLWDLLKIYSPSVHQRSGWVCFFIRFVEVSQQWMLCSEWVPSEWESDKNITVHQLTSGEDKRWNKSIIKYESIIHNNASSHSDGTHSLQSIHCWDISPNLMKKQTHLQTISGLLSELSLCFEPLRLINPFL